MMEMLRRLLGFDRLIGPALVKIVYYFGAAMIVLFILGTLFTGLFSILGGNLGAGAMQLLAAPAVGAVGFVYWRFVCELFMLAFLTYQRMGEVRDLMRIAAGQPAAPDPNYPAF